MSGSLSAPPAACQLVLDDGRRLGYARYGAPGGTPVIYLHGLPGSRLECSLIDAPARAAGLEVIAPDRPGYGLTEPRGDLSLSAWTDDIAGLADALDVERFSVIGVSGGAPCALACAHALGERIERVTLVAGLGPLHHAALRRELRSSARLALWLANRNAALFDALVGRPVAALAKHRPALLIRLIGAANNAADRDILLRPHTLAAFSPSLRACFEQGSVGSLRDLQIFSRHWGFDIETIRQPVQLWHGDDDRVVPRVHSEYLHARLAESRLNIVPGAGHFSLPLGHAQRIVEALRG